MSYPKLPELGKKDWAKDPGFREYLNANARNKGGYYQDEKGHKTLFELIIYMDDFARPHLFAYYELPDDTTAFCKWAWDWVAWQGNVAKTKQQNEYFNYPVLYQLFQERGALKESVLHYKDRLTDQEGTLIVQLKKTR